MRGRRPDPNSISGRIRGFFEANPDEYLTYADICTKFGVTPDQAHKAVEKLRERWAPLQCVTVVRLKAEE